MTIIYYRTLFLAFCRKACYTLQNGKKEGSVSYMKKALFCMTSLFAVFCLLIQPVFIASAQEAKDTMVVVSRTVEYLDDGSRIITTVMQTPPDRAMNSTISGQKEFTFESIFGVQFTFTLCGTFTYGSGSNAVCTSARYEYVIQNSTWSLESASASKSQNTAFGTATFVHKILGITIETKSTSLQLTCSNSGTLS